VPWLGSDDTMQLLWRISRCRTGRYPVRHRRDFHADGRLGNPRDQHADPADFRRDGDLGALGLKKNNRAQLIWGLVATIALGMLFLTLQAYEYVHAYHELNLTLSMGRTARPSSC